MKWWLCLGLGVALLAGCQGQGVREPAATRAAVGGPVNRETEEPATRRFMERGWVDGRGATTMRGVPTTSDATTRRDGTTREAGDGR